MNIIKLLSIFGGLLGAAYKFFEFLANIINNQLFVGKLISEMYIFKFGPDQKHELLRKRTEKIGNSKNLLQVKFGFLDSFKMIRRYCCFWSKTENMKAQDLSSTIYSRAASEALQELNVAHMCTTIRKLKAGVAAVIEENTKAKRDQLI